MVEKPVMVKLKRIERENERHRTYYFEFDKASKAKPGQFLMVWLPEIDEKPISLSKISEKEIGITVQCKGKWSESICSIPEGKQIGVRGPYGNGYSTEGIKSAIIVAGGCGTAPIRPLVDKCIADGIETRLVMGAQNKSGLLFESEMKEKLGDNLYITTDDGSAGTKGFTTTVLGEQIAKEKPEMVFSCGPEIMLKAVLGMCEKAGVKCQLSLERYMRCGFGVCGQCAMNELLICKDGPIFSGEVLAKSSEFGNIARLKSGLEVSLKEYADWRQC